MVLIYSRWSNSVWYTYPNNTGGFTVCGEKSFTSEEMLNIDKCIDYFRSYKNNYTETQLEELKTYMEKHNEVQEDQIRARVAKSPERGRYT